MSKIGLKYIAPGEIPLPAINGGKWNIAANFNYDYNFLLKEAGIDREDFDSVALFLRYSSVGVFICAAKRRDVSAVGAPFHALWAFIPYNVLNGPELVVICCRHLPLILNNPQAFSSPEALSDIIPDFFFTEHPAITTPMEDNTYKREEGKTENKMEGSRLGFIAVDSEEEVKVIAECGYKPQFANFGLILLTENPVKVEASLPRIMLPELLFARTLRGTQEKDSSSLPIQEEDEVKVDENREDEGIVDETREDEVRVDEKSGDEVRVDEKSGDGESEETRIEEIIEVAEGDQPNDSTPAEVLPEEVEEKGEERREEFPVSNSWSFDWISFILGLGLATAISIAIFFFNFKS